MATIEVPHLLRLVEDNQFDTIYHEHFPYFSFLSAQQVFAAHGLEVVRRRGAADATAARCATTPSASTPASQPVGERVHDLVARERAPASTRSRGTLAFAARVEETKWSLLEFLIAQRREGKRIAGYGAPGKGNTLLNYCGIRTDLLAYTVDRNPYKQGQFLPGTHIPILHPEVLERDRPDYILILPWNLKRGDRRAARLRARMGRALRRPDPAGGGPVKVVLFCGGLGLRMREASEVVPKPMIPVGNRPILWHVMKYYAHYGSHDFVLCLGYKAEVIKEYFLNYNEAHGERLRPVARAGAKVHLLKTRHRQLAHHVRRHRACTRRSASGSAAVRHLLRDDEMFLANYGDTLTDAPLPAMVERVEESGVTASFLAVKPNYSFHVVIVNDDGRGRRDHTTSRKSDIWINGGYFVFRSTFFDYMRPGEDLVEEPFQRADRRRPVLAHRHEGFWAPMDTLKEKQGSRACTRAGQAPWELWDDRAATQTTALAELALA